MHECVIWGAGYLGGKQMAALGNELVSFFIDNDVNKVSQGFCGKRVLLPNEVTMWEKYHLFVPKNYYKEIMHQISNLFDVDKMEITIFDGVNKINSERYMNDYNRAQKELNRYCNDMKDAVLFWGWNFVQKSNYKKLFENVKETPVYVIAENIWITQQEAEKENGVHTIMAPIIFDRDFVLINRFASPDDIAFIETNKYLYYAAYKLKAQHEDISFSEACCNVMEMLAYVETVICKMEPRIITTTGSRTVESFIIRYACEKNSVKYLTNHPAFIPGTILFDENGDSGETILNSKFDEFMNLPIDFIDIEKTRQVLKYIKDTGANRKIQPKIDIAEMKEKICGNGKKTVLFVAQVDLDLQPYDEYISSFFSPVFKSSEAAGVYLSKLAKKNDWNFIYKAHPLDINYRIVEKLMENSTFVDIADINQLIDIADVVVTIQSSTDYIALIRGKPVVMLGFDHSKGKGFTYEAFEYEQIEQQIKCAIEEGLTEGQIVEFEKFVARNLKYYLFDDLSSRELRYGKIIESSADEIVVDFNVKET